MRQIYWPYCVKSKNAETCRPRNGCYNAAVPYFDTPSRRAARGKKIEIVPFDNKANPQGSLIVLRQAIDQDIH
jgi:hypothetical protein